MCHANMMPYRFRRKEGKKKKINWAQSFWEATQTIKRPKTMKVIIFSASELDKWLLKLCLLKNGSVWSFMLKLKHYKPKGLV